MRIKCKHHKNFKEKINYGKVLKDYQMEKVNQQIWQIKLSKDHNKQINQLIVDSYKKNK